MQANTTSTRVIRRDVVKAENGAYSVVAVLTNGGSFWHNGFATKSEAKTFARWA